MMLQVFDPQKDYTWSWATLAGPDAQDFLHRITSVNVKSLQVGEGARGCLLTPQGKLVAYFTLWNYAPESYGFEFEAGTEEKWKSALFAGIDKYTFSEKMLLSDVTKKQGLHCLWVFSDQTNETLGTAGLAPLKTQAAGDEIRFCHHGSQTFGKTWISLWGKPESLKLFASRALATATSLTYQQVESWRIRSLSPRVDHELSETIIPLEAGLSDAVASNKGCYPGQEVIEKIVSLGSPSKRLVLIEGPYDGTGEIQIHQKLMSTATPPAEIGELTSVFHENEKFYALGLVRKIHAKENFPIQIHSQSRQDFSGTISRVAPYA